MHTGMRMFTYKDTHLRVYPYGLQHGSPVLPRRTGSWEPIPLPPTLAVHLHVCMRARVCGCACACVCVVLAKEYHFQAFCLWMTPPLDYLDLVSIEQ
jgi:hypothetical protein